MMYNKKQLFKKTIKVFASLLFVSMLLVNVYTNTEGSLTLGISNAYAQTGGPCAGVGQTPYSLRSGQVSTTRVGRTTTRTINTDHSTGDANVTLGSGTGTYIFGIRLPSSKGKTVQVVVVDCNGGAVGTCCSTINWNPNLGPGTITTSPLTMTQPQ